MAADLSKAAAVCKAAYLQAIAGVSAVRSAIASSPDWGWCKPAFLEDLDKAEAKLKEVMEASGASSWVEVPVKLLKGKWGEEKFAKEMMVLANGVVEKHVADVSQEVEQLHAYHKAQIMKSQKKTKEGALTALHLPKQGLEPRDIR